MGLRSQWAYDGHLWAVNCSGFVDSWDLLPGFQRVFSGSVTGLWPQPIVVPFGHGLGGLVLACAAEAAVAEQGVSWPRILWHIMAYCIMAYLGIGPENGPLLYQVKIVHEKQNDQDYIMIMNHDTVDSCRFSRSC